MNLKLQTTIQVIAPPKTKVITNDDWVTLARKSNGNVLVFTCRIEDLSSYDLFDDDNWIELTPSEISELNKL